jgi:Na+-translocating ferredoxin:NAD+ oxidoreductase RnfA subunit
MHATLLVFLAAAWLDRWALDFFLAGPGSRRNVLVPGAAIGAVLALAVAVRSGIVPAGLPLDAAPLARYLALFAFFAVLLQSCRPLPESDATSRPAPVWLRYVPLLVANAAVLACVALGVGGIPDAGVGLATAAGATLAIALLLPVGTAFLDRLRLAAAPTAWRGAPLALLSAATVALGASGWASVLPW